MYKNHCHPLVASHLPDLYIITWTETHSFTHSHNKSFCVFQHNFNSSYPLCQPVFNVGHIIAFKNSAKKTNNSFCVSCLERQPAFLTQKISYCCSGHKQITWKLSFWGSHPGIMSNLLWPDCFHPTATACFAVEHPFQYYAFTFWRGSLLRLPS